MTLALLAIASLAGCKPPASADSSHAKHGRYQGIGLYAPSETWARQVGAEAAKDPKTARLLDDDEIIVVVDSATGEVRQCGNLSGYCVGSNPWTRTLAAGQTLPLQVNQHAAVPVRERPAAESAAPAH
jgi:hypothetical protein